MKKTIGIGLIMLSVYLCNSHSSTAATQKLTQASQISFGTDTELKVTADISSRDDQTRDCLRKRRCID